MSSTPPLTNPDEPATKRQTYAIFVLGGGDVREQNLTRQAASDLIEKLSAAKEAKTKQKYIPKAKREKAAKTDPFIAILAAANKAADEAGDEWLKNARPSVQVVQRANPFDDTSPIIRAYEPMLDVCGMAGITIRDRRTIFAKWVKANQGYNGIVHLAHKHKGRQEWGLNDACVLAAFRVLTENGVKGIDTYSRID